MKPISKDTVNRIINDKELAPLFIDYVAENLKMTLSSRCEVGKAYDLKFKRNASKSLITLITKLQTKIDADCIELAIEVVCNYYVSGVFPYVRTQNNN